MPFISTPISLPALKNPPNVQSLDGLMGYDADAGENALFMWPVIMQELQKDSGYAIRAWAVIGDDGLIKESNNISRIAISMNDNSKFRIEFEDNPDTDNIGVGGSAMRQGDLSDGSPLVMNLVTKFHSGSTYWVEVEARDVTNLIGYGGPSGHVINPTLHSAYTGLFVFFMW